MKLAPRGQASPGPPVVTQCERAIQSARPPGSAVLPTILSRHGGEAGELRGLQPQSPDMQEQLRPAPSPVPGRV